MRNVCYFFCFSILCSMAFANSNSVLTAAKLEQIKQHSVKLRHFLAQMPKGGDLHNHIDGAIYAEDLIALGQNQNFCLKPKSFTVYKNKNCDPKFTLENALKDKSLYNQVIDAWSMRHFPLDEQSGQQHFFDSFLKFAPIVNENLAKVIAKNANRSAADQQIYLETLLGDLELPVLSDKQEGILDIGKRVKKQPSLSQWRETLLNEGLQSIINKTIPKVALLHKQVKQELACNSKNPQPGCKVTIRYQYFSLRDIPLPQFYAQLVAAFGVANQSPYVVGINIVMPENWQTAIEDYQQHMAMIAYLHSQYPAVNISLHAGELGLDQHPSSATLNHVWQAINTAKAQRIGHGVDIPFERNPQGLLKKLAAKKIAIEVNLTSNYDVLGIKGHQHPLPLFVEHGVPVVLSTDDPGIERTTLTDEYLKAAIIYDFPYSQLKQFARNSLTYSFLPGHSLWADARTAKPVNECRDFISTRSSPSKRCQQFLANSLKAQLQWQLEQQLMDFEQLAKKNDKNT